jgi:hypothetical protein
MYRCAINAKNMFSNIEIEKMHSDLIKQPSTTKPSNRIIETKENFFQGMVTSVSLIFKEGYCWFIAGKTKKVLQSKSRAIIGQLVRRRRDCHAKLPNQLGQAN